MLPAEGVRLLVPEPGAVTSYTTGRARTNHTPVVEVRRWTARTLTSEQSGKIEASAWVHSTVSVLLSGTRTGADWGEGHTVDASVVRAEEGRGRAAKRPGELRASGDPGVSEWGNLARWGAASPSWEG
jgi:hypothetical protein